MDEQSDRSVSGRKPRRRARNRGRQHDDVEPDREPRRSLPPAQGNPETVRVLAEMGALYQERQSRLNKIKVTIFVVALLFAIYKWPDWHWGSLMFLFFAMVFANTLFPVRSGITEYGYYLIPGSVDSRGEHVCIYCGGRGIYRKGEYKTNIVRASCSKCRTYLWTE